MSIKLIKAAAFALALMGCVSHGDYDAALNENARLRDAMHNAATTQQQELATLRAQRDIARAGLGDHVKLLDAAKSSNEVLGLRLDEADALNHELKAQLERAGKDVNKLIAKGGKLAAALVATKARLALLRQARAAAEQRAKLHREIAAKLHKMVDAGELRIVLRNGRMVLQLANDVLFDSAQTKIKPKGQTALEAVAQVLAPLENRRFQIAGHTDNVPIYSSRYASNWELSAGRAIAVVNLLMNNEIAATRLSAAAYGEYDPVADNATGEGKARNRRIEITLVSNVDELVTLPKE